MPIPVKPKPSDFWVHGGAGPSGSGPAKTPERKTRHIPSKPADSKAGAAAASVLSPAQGQGNRYSPEEEAFQLDYELGAAERKTTLKTEPQAFEQLLGRVKAQMQNDVQAVETEPYVEMKLRKISALLRSWDVDGAWKAKATQFLDEFAAIQAGLPLTDSQHKKWVTLAAELNTQLNPPAPQPAPSAAASPQTAPGPAASAPPIDPPAYSDS